MINFTYTRRVAYACLPVLAVLFGLLVLPPLSSSVNTTPATAQEQPKTELPPLECGDLAAPPHFYTYESPKESKHAFGPRVVPANATEELWNRLCGFIAPDGTIVGGDWALLQALRSKVDDINPNHTLTMGQWQKEVRDFTDRIDWKRYRVVRESSHHEPEYTLYMTGKRGSQPIVHAGKVNRQRSSTYLLLTVKQRSGDVAKLRLRLECGLQPVYDYSAEPQEARGRPNAA